MVEETNSEEGVVLVPWEPQRSMRTLSADESRFARGFLRSKPGKWFPALTAHWLPLAHSLGVELQIEEIKPLLAAPAAAEVRFAGSVDGEPIALMCDLNTKAAILAGVVPSAMTSANDVVFEYLARRLLSSLGESWSGGESSMVLFDAEAQYKLGDLCGFVKLAGTANSNPFTVWIGLSRNLVERLDGLWRRQVQSTAKITEGGGLLHFEVAQLAVPPTMLADYLRTGTVIDLEVLASETVQIRLGSKLWGLGKLVMVNNQFAVEMTGGMPVAPVLPEGTTRLAIEIGAQNVDAATLAELTQVGSVLLTEVPVSDSVQLVINGEGVGSAALCSYQGRFAITVN
jgi:flagellar motor switch/type III secretory pathway protein FliN